MKKFFNHSLLAMLVAMTLVLTACGTKEEKKDSAQASSSSQGVSSEEQTSSKESKTAKEGSVDVVVIGAGGAGMSAALTAKESGASVVILEKEAMAGGNTTRATGGMNAAESKFQAAAGIKDSKELFAQETIKGGHDKNDKALVKYLADHSAEAIDWLDKLGMPLSNVTFSGGFSVARIHRPKDGSAVGNFLVEHFVEKLKEREIPLFLNTRATELLRDEKGNVVGVKAVGPEGEMTLHAKSVILATGGFGANLEMVSKLKPELKGFVTTNTKGAEGDGLTMAEKLGAATVDLDQIQIHPTVEQSTSDLITEALRGEGAILVNLEGKRFINEMETRDVVSQAELKQKESSVYILFDQKVRDNNKAVEKYIKKGYTLEGESLETLAKEMKVDPETLVTTLKTYNQAVATGKDSEFGRSTGLKPIDQAKFYAIRVAPGIHHTMGGLKINTETLVLDKEGKAIPGLFAAGEVTGGVHGANRIGGNAVCDIVVFGREAGTKAGEYALAHGGSGKTDLKAPQSQAGEAKPDEGVAAQFKDGNYQETAQGNNGPVTVEMTVEAGYITKITAVKQQETPAMFKGVEEKLIPEIIRKQSAAVDTVSGATNSSKAVLEAVSKMMDKAKK